MCVCVEHSDMMESIVGSLQEKMDDWRKAANALDKDHSKGEFVLLLAHGQMNQYS